MKTLKQAEAIGSQHYDLRSEADEVVDEFLSESRERLDQIERELNELGGGTAASELLLSIFRNLHSIKGASGFLGFARLETIAHAGESMLSGIREGTLALSPEVKVTLQEALNSMQNVLDSLASSGNEGSGDDAELLNKLCALKPQDKVRPEKVADAGENGLAQPEAVRESASEDFAKPIGQLLIERAGVYPAAIQSARDLQRQGDLRTIGEILVSQGAVTPVAAREIVEYQQEARAASVADTSVRVEVMLLDKIATLAGNLERSANRLVRLVSGGQDPTVRSATKKLLRVATRLHREVVKTRVQPLAVVEVLLVRLVKDLCRLSGKRVRLESKGTKVRVDRLVLVALKDPLLHLVRNAVDHGIEPPQVRATAGKPMEGRVTIRATCIDSQVVVEVSDDGAGIDLDRVRQKAVEQGLIGPDRIGVTSDAEIADLVFLPGFTTARTVSRISGRGVGMDIVKAKVEKIGGRVALSTRKGRGTTVRLAVPLAQPSLVR